MTQDRHNRSVSLLCPTCGCDQFEFEAGAEETIEFATCASCNRTLTKDEIIQENSENIQTNLDEIGEEIRDELVKEFRDSLKKTFRGSKNINIK